MQKARQDRLGLGWANHDHHTFRCSRRFFPRVIGMFTRLGFELRERFHAGAHAGWGAQIVEHPVTGIVIFADLDLAPEEATEDFAHQVLAGPAAARAPSACGSPCTASRSSKPACTTWKPSSTSTPSATASRPRPASRPCRRSRTSRSSARRSPPASAGRSSRHRADRVLAGWLDRSRAAREVPPRRDDRQPPRKPRASRRLQGLQPAGRQRDHRRDRSAAALRSRKSGFPRLTPSNRTGPDPVGSGSKA